jgi:hypothetical protein
MNPPQQQQFLEQIEQNDDDDYLQVLDAGEHMYGMFVTDDEDLYAYLNSNSGEELSLPLSPLSSSWMIPSTEDIEDIIHMSVVQNKQECGVEDDDCCCAASFADMHIRGKVSASAGGELSGSFDCNIETDGTNTGRLTPTRNGDDIDDHDHDAMHE